MMIVSFPLYSAGPITHVVLGEMWLSHVAPNYTEEQKKEFLLGTVFPDIRYLGVIKREKTHIKGVTLSAVQKASSPFQQGVLFHSFVDEYREKWVREHRAYDKLTDITEAQRHTFLKLIEDQILYTERSMNSFRTYLMSILPEEEAYGIDEKSLSEWHTGLTLYFTASPALLLTQLSFLEKDVLTIKAPTIKQWSELLPKYAEQQEYSKHVSNLLLVFEKVMNQ